MQNGSEILVYGSEDEDYFYPQEAMKSLMELYRKKLIDSFSLVTLDLNDVCLKSDFYITNYGKTVNSYQRFLAVNSAYFASTTSNDLKIAQQNNKYKDYSPSEQLYFSDFRGKIGISAIFTYEFNANLDSKIFLKISKTKSEMQFLSQPAFILDSAGGLQMNSQPSMRVTRHAIISFQQYLDILQKCRNYFAEKSMEFLFIGYGNMPLWGMNIKPKEGATEDEIDEISNIIKYYGPGSVDLWLYSSLNSRLDMISNIVFLIFYIISSVVLIFCLFNLTASMTINIFEQKKEIAIMRSLGMKRRHVIFVYIAEAFILILGSSIVGTIIGSIISYTMALQWGIFTNVNVGFNLPAGSVIVIVLISILGGIFSTYVPARNMLNKPIAELIKAI
jgi:ABC-type antimicrobial peptide transport system permease subunit